MKAAHKDSNQSDQNQTFQIKHRESRVICESEDSHNFPFSLFKEIIINTPTPLSIKDENLRWVFLNDAFCKFFGYSRKSLILKKGDDAISKDDREVLCKKDDIVLSTGRGEISVERALDAKGKIRVIQTKKWVCQDQSGQKWIIGNYQDVTEYKNAEKKLEEKEIALKEIMEQIEIEKMVIKTQIFANIDSLILPTLNNLKKVVKASDQKQVKILEKNLQLITSSFGHQISRKYYGLTPTEIEVCNLIKNGFKTKDIAQLLHISSLTVETHRNRIRRKLSITNKRVNLVSFLQNL